MSSARVPAIAPAGAGAPGGPGLGGCPLGSADPRGSDSSLPANENNQRPSLRLLPASAVPPANTTTYCLPWYSTVEAGALTPPSVWNSHSLRPLVLSNAVRRPSLRPTNTRPPAVTNDPL